MPLFNGDYRSALIEHGKEEASQRAGVSLSYLRGDWDALYYHSAVMIAWNRIEPFLEIDEASKGETEGRDLTDGDIAECVIYTPHGLHPSSASKVTSSSPPIRPLALLHGLHDVKLDWSLQLNLGAKNGLAAQRVLRAKHWIGTHDEVKKGGGLVGWFLRRKEWTTAEAVEESLKDEQKVIEKGHKEQEVREKEMVDLAETFLALENGQSVVLA